MSSLKNKKVFITGATGFLGSHLMERLLKEGAMVSALYRSEEKLLTFKKQLKFDFSAVHWVKGDLFTDWSLQGYDIVYHLAGFISYKKEDREQMERVNVQGTKRVLSKIEEAEYRPKLIYLSSVVAVGAGLNKSQILNEKSPFNLSKFNFGYFETKKKAEEIVFKETQKGLCAVTLNPSTVYGPRSLEKSSRKFQVKATKGQLKFCSEGGVSVIHVDDFCDAVISATEKGVSGERYILSGDNITIYELLNELAQQNNAQGPRFIIPNVFLLFLGRISQLLLKFGINIGLNYENLKVATMYHWFDSSKAQKELGFKPRPYKEALRE